MKLGCISWSAHQAFEKGRIGQIDWIKKCANEYKLDGVELLENHFHRIDKQYLKDLKRLTINLGLTIYGVVMNSDFGLNSQEERNKQIEKTRNWSGIAQCLGAPVLRIFSGIHRGVDKKDMDRLVGTCARYGELWLGYRRLQTYVSLYRKDYCEGCSNPSETN